MSADSIRARNTFRIFPRTFLPHPSDTPKRIVFGFAVVRELRCRFGSRNHAWADAVKCL